MCRFVLYVGNPIRLSSLITEPENSLIHQSFDNRERSEPLNGDGFGVAWYEPELQASAALFRSVTPAWNNQNLRHLARVTASGCVLAHVRAASFNMAVTESNTHPFVFQNYAFMHNGEIAQFRHLRHQLMDGLSAPYDEMIEGTTDSEYIFAHTLQVLTGRARVAEEVTAGVTAKVTAEGMAAALEQTIDQFLALSKARGIDEPCDVNIAMSNGIEAIACRFSTAADREAPSLHYHHGKLYSCRSGTPELLEAAEDEHAVIVSSEVLTDDDSWAPVPNNSIVLIDAGRACNLRPLKAGSTGETAH